MKFECKKCGARFSKNWGRTGCPQCGSEDLWTTGGEIKAIVVVLVAAAAILAFCYVVSKLAFVGAAIGVLVALPVSI